MDFFVFCILNRRRTFDTGRNVRKESAQVEMTLLLKAALFFNNSAAMALHYIRPTIATTNADLPAASQFLTLTSWTHWPRFNPDTSICYDGMSRPFRVEFIVSRRSLPTKDLVQLPQVI